MNNEFPLVIHLLFLQVNDNVLTYLNLERRPESNERS
nr:MAG TPA: hypothetical protein [Caudoviricetes sp.]